MRWRIHFHSDIRTAIAAPAKSTTESALVWKNMRALEKLPGSNGHFSMDTWAAWNTSK